MASINILLRKVTNSKGEQPLIMRIVKNRKSKIITLGLNCNTNDWDSKNGRFKRSAPNASQRNRIILLLEQKALQIIDQFKMDQIDFTLDQFASKFKDRPISSYSVKEFWNKKISDLEATGRTGNARAYQDTMKSFYKFNKSDSIKFKDITPALLFEYETYLRNRGNQDGGIAVKMREIRALFNDAMNKGLVEEKHYPFKAYKISKLKGKAVKKALTREQVRALESVDISKHPHLIHTKNYFIFSYYTAGMNFADMLKLTWDNINSGRIQYVRSKTKGKFSIQILEPVRNILEYYRNRPSKTNYIFPMLLAEGLTPKQIEYRKQRVLKQFNRELKELAQLANINQDISSYTIRHSYATNLKHAGVSTDIIGESMGHTNVKVTQAYLKEFENDAIDNAMNKLLEEPTIKYVA